MLLRIALFALMALGLVGFGAVAWISTMSPRPDEAAATQPVVPPEPPPPPPKANVLVAAHQLRGGSFLKADDIQAAEILASQMPPGAVADTPAARGRLQGAMLRHGMGSGQVIDMGDVLRPGDHGFLSAVLTPGMRAVSMGLNEVASDWGLLWPGDHIDLILTQSFEAADTLARRRFAAETVLTDVRVVAVDQQLVQGASAEDAERKGSHTLTVEVSPKQAERLAVATRLGKLNIALRSAANAKAANPAPSANFRSPDASALPLVTWSGDVAHALGQPTRTPSPPTVLLFRGNAGRASGS